MQLSLYTLYIVGLGTLAVAAVMTVWERHFNAERARELAFWAAGYLTMGVGCALLLGRSVLPLVVTQGLSNLLIVGGYGLLLAGALPFVGIRLPRATLLVAVVPALLWLLIGPRLSLSTWSAVGSLGVALPCFTMALLLLLNGTAGATRSWVLASVVFGLHGMVYLSRIVVIPFAYSMEQPSVLDSVALFTMFEGVLFSMAAPMALLSLTREESRHHLLRASQTDFLTGLENRRAFTLRATPLIANHAGGAEPPSLLVLFDLDHFKQINDRYGHDAGDQVLKIFARTARDHLGPADCIARMGGEEFAALLSGREIDEVQRLLRTIATRFTIAVHAETAVTRHVTFSAGLVPAREGETLRSLMSAADRLLYRAKQSGRNRVEMDPTPGERAALDPSGTALDLSAPLPRAASR